MNAPILEESFVSYLCTSLSLAPSFRALFTTLSATAHQTGRKLTSADVIWHLTEEATSIEIEDNINKSNAAMLATTSKSKGGKTSRNDRLCDNCGRKGHTSNQCFEKGGGKEGQAPEWWKKSRENKANANVAESKKVEDEPENYAMASVILSDDTPDDPRALVCTSDFHSEAHAAANHTGSIINSGASRHFSPERAKFLNYVEFANSEPIRAADGRTFSALGKGDLETYLPNGDQKPTLTTLKNVLYSPNMAFTLISVSCVDRAGYSLFIKGGYCTLRDQNSKIIGRIPEVRGLYRITDTISQPPHFANAAVRQISINELHRRMGHVNHEDLRRMIEKGMVTGIDLDLSSTPDFCDVCIKAKATRKPFPKESQTEYKAYGDKVVADVWGPAPVKSIGGKEYYVLFKDLFSHEERIYFLKQKSEVFECYKKYEAWLKVQRNGRIGILGCDRGGEFTSQGFTDYLENAGTVRHLTVHDSPASNGVVERANRTHLDGARAMMETAKLPKNLWAEAINYHVWIRNRVPTRAISEPKTPLEIAIGMKPDLSMVRPWGCTIWVKRLDVGKLKPRAEECRFVGIDSESKGYRVYWPGKNRVGIERDVYFNENDALEPEEALIEGGNDLPTNPSLLQQSSNPEHNLLPLQPITTTPNEPNKPEPDEAPVTTLPNQTDDPNNLPSVPHKRLVRRNSLQGLTQYDNEQFGRGKRRRALTQADAGIADAEEVIDVEEVADAEEAITQKGMVIFDQGGADTNEAGWSNMEMENAMAISEDEPLLKEALKGDEREAWIDAIEAELKQMEKVNAWAPVIPPRDANIIPSRYVFRRKRNDTGKIVRYKARLVVKGFKQQFGVDYVETFAPTVRAPTLRILLSFAAQKGAAIHQCDVKNAYLNSRLQGDVTLYSELPPMYRSFRELPPDLKDKPNVVSKWFVSVYGSKQGAHDWYSEVKTFFTDKGYSISTADEAVFFKLEDNKFTIVAAATDDFTVIADSTNTANFLIQKQLTERFEISDLGPINWLLGVSITRDTTNRTISLGQQAYIEQILNRFGLEDARKAVTPMEVGIDLSPDSPHVSPTLLTPAEKTKY